MFFGPQDLGPTSWALASLNMYHHKPLLNAIASECQPFLLCSRHFSTQSLTRTSWSVFIIPVAPGSGAWLGVAAALFRRAEFRPGELANMAWAVALLVLIDAPLLNALSPASTFEFGIVGPQELANIVWALARLTLVHIPLFAVIAQRSLLQLVSFDSQNRANSAWAISTRDFAHEPLF